jgi:carbonic anhydrase
MTTAQGQDYKKVIEVVQKMETNLKNLLADEEKARKAESDQLRDEIRALREGKTVVTAASQSPRTEEKPAVDPKVLLDRLVAGNARFVAGKPIGKDMIHDRAELTKAQHPYAIVLTCADSRVPPELIFDESLGQLFVVRNAGNIIDSVTLGSIEYAAEHLHATLLLVLGHESCGAIKATIAGGPAPANIGSIVSRIQPVIDQMKAEHIAEIEMVGTCVETNVRRQMALAESQSTLVRELIEKNQLHIVGATYGLGTGKVTYLSSAIGSPENKAASDHAAVQTNESKP